MNRDDQIRAAAFLRMRELEARYGGAIPWIEVTAPMMVAGEEVRLAGRARGIFRPRQMSRGALSIKTTVPRAGRTRRYDDIASDEGFFEYRFMGDDPKHADNRALQESWHDRSPLIYFHGVAPALYQAIWPVFVTHWDAKNLTAHVVPGESTRSSAAPASEDLRRYAVIQAKQRLHQAVFREMVIEAYGGRCAVSGLPEKRLLHAAHILPDRDRRGQPIVSNGIAMSVLHHSAYDLNLLGIDPGGVIHINRDLLEIHDGPTLRHALQDLDHAKMKEPDDPARRPNRDFLAERFEQFNAAA
jgi:putative restriction endonuclease